jgi:phage host-nuclease inhibitor protein Gam
MNDITTLTADSPLASDDACAAAIAELGTIARTLAAIETEESNAVARATKAAEDKATPLLSQRAALEAKVQAWCTKERARLTRNGETKSVGFAFGAVHWRMGKGKVEIDDRLKEKILDALTHIRGFYDRFTSVKTDLSKAKMLAATDAEKKKLGEIRGVKFVAGREDFTIQPAGAVLATRPEEGSRDA